MEIFFGVVGFVVKAIGYFIAGIAGLVVLAIIFGNKVHWKFRAEGFSEAFAKDKVRVKLRDIDKKGQSVEIKGRLKLEHQDKPVTVLLNGFRIAEFSSAQNNGSPSMAVPLDIESPKRGDTLSLRLGELEIYSEKLV